MVRIKIVLRYSLLLVPVLFLLSIFSGSSYTISTLIFQKILSLIFFIAFVSIGIQIKGLIGSKGILPISEHINNIRLNYGGSIKSFPTIFWFKNNDKFLVGICILGAILSLLNLTDAFTNIIFLILTLLYLSIVVAGQEFTSFQWDILLVEAGFTAVFLTFQTNVAPFLFLWLLFRIIFMSGYVKLTSGDQSWRKFKALSFHYLTQPLPTIFGWFGYKLPAKLNQFSTATALFIEFIIPFLIFIPGFPQYIAAFVIFGLMSLILLTGNYGFFNILVISICLFLFDNKFWDIILPSKIYTALLNSVPSSNSFNLFTPFSILFGGFIIAVTGFHMYKRLGGKLSDEFEKLLFNIQPFCLVNSYGPFANISTQRFEIIIEGSLDHKTWHEYEFKFKPGKIKRHPRWNTPHQPRLDWQMWFAALSDAEYNPWFEKFLVRLLEGSKDVLNLMEKAPINPKYIRATLYEYKYSSFKTLKASHKWWSREKVKSYYNELSLKK